MTSTSSNIQLRVHCNGAVHEISLPKEDREPVTLQTWGELLNRRSIPTLFLAAVSVKGSTQLHPYEATNLHHYLKLENLKSKDLLDPVTKLPIEKIHIVAMQTFSFDKKGHVQEAVSPYDFHEIKALPSKDWMETECDPLTPLTPDQCFSKGLRVNECSNPLLSREDLAKVQFVVGCTLLGAPLRTKPTAEMRTGKDSPPLHRTEVSDEAARYLTCASINGNEDAKGLTHLIAQGHWGLFPRSKKLEKYVNKVRLKIKFHPPHSPKRQNSFPDLSQALPEFI